MFAKTLLMHVMAGAFALIASWAWADDFISDDEDPGREQQQVRAQTLGMMYGSQLMTQKERAAYRTRMHNAKTAEERELISKEHHERMQERAKKLGMILPDEPTSARGGMMEPGGGMGKGDGGR